MKEEALYNHLVLIEDMLNTLIIQIQRFREVFDESTIPGDPEDVPHGTPVTYPHA